MAAYYRPSGKNVNRYPDMAESDEWGVKPTGGYEIVFTDDEMKQYEKDRSARDILSNSPKEPFHDRQLERAVECVLAQLQ